MTSTSNLSLPIEITIEFDPNSISTTEGAGVTATLRLVSSRPIQGATVVRVVHIPGTAVGMLCISAFLTISLSLSLFDSLPPTAANDYVAFDARINFSVGSTEHTLVVNIFNDNVFELPESLEARLTLVSGKGVTIGQNDVATIYIDDDDGIHTT